MIEWLKLKVGDEVYWGNIRITDRGGLSRTNTYYPAKYRIIEVKPTSVSIKRIDGCEEIRKRMDTEIVIIKYSYGHNLYNSLYDSLEELESDWNSYIYNQIDRFSYKLNNSLTKINSYYYGSV